MPSELKVSLDYVVRLSQKNDFLLFYYFPT